MNEDGYSQMTSTLNNEPKPEGASILNIAI